MLGLTKTLLARGPQRGRIGGPRRGFPALEPAQAGRHLGDSAYPDGEGAGGGKEMFRRGPDGSPEQ